jgi:threonine aldolase
MPDAVLRSMNEKGWHLYTFIGTGGARLMCSWDTKEETIADFIRDLKAAIVETR